MSEVSDASNALLRGLLLSDDDFQDAEAKYPGYIRLGPHTRHGATLAILGKEVHYNLVGGDVRHFEHWERFDITTVPEPLQRLARHRAAEAVLGVRLGHEAANERKRRKKRGRSR